MLNPTKPGKVKLIIGFLYSSNDLYDKAKKSLEKKMGPTDFESNIIEFRFTDYYREEMGSNLKRRFVSFKRLIQPEDIVQIKLFTIKIEKKFSILNKRRINIDPGYLNEAKILLSTTKDYSHRIYLDKRIFAEITLIYKNRGFQNLPWTYPDFRTKLYKEIFLKVRNIYKEQIKKDSGAKPAI